ncbi:MAG: tetratricopeptide repeat protein [Xenococcaceae cyanobacterium MO_207.B15]|nr:tetratricopeptide repeat protein [Xenococcaceae cyanobacterium MO_207.B15]MDJ0746143.1 tetratricopeptide repeat protein [Xenococcaceae cyanobacterium MO_167.B27]
MTESVETLFDQALEKYQAGESVENLLPTFQEICDRDPKNSAAWTCLAWLYLLLEQPKRALKAAERSVRLEPRDPQAQVNLALAMLEVGQKGVRKHIEIVQQAVDFDEKIKNMIQENIEDGLNRKPDWKSLQKVNNWLFG